MFEAFCDLLDSSVLDEAFEEAQQLKDLRDYKMIRTNLSRKILGAKFWFYGSRVMGVGDRDSDLDIFVDIDSYYVGLPRDRIEMFISLLDERMRQDTVNWDVKIAILATRVPVIRAKFIPSQIWCDITFTSGLGVENTLMVEHLFAMQPEAAKFCIFIKKWFALNGLRIRNYIVTLLSIFYLQLNNYLPSIQEVQQGLHPVFIEGCDVQFDRRRDLRYYQLRKLRKFHNEILNNGFYEYFSRFDYENNIMHLFTGDVKYKEALRFDHQWMKPMSISGPIGKDNNHAMTVGPNRLQEFINFCSDTFNAIG